MFSEMGSPNGFSMGSFSFKTQDSLKTEFSEDAFQINI